MNRAFTATVAGSTECDLPSAQHIQTEHQEPEDPKEIAAIRAIRASFMLSLIRSSSDEDRI
jgi:hypothetical protein